MYLCNDCEAVFETPETATRESTVPYVQCPCCGSDDVEEADLCDCCCEVTRTSALTKLADIYACDDCLAELQEKIKRNVRVALKVSAAWYGISYKDACEAFGGIDDMEVENGESL